MSSDLSGAEGGSRWIHAMVLAAGASERLQGHIKALSRCKSTGKTLLDHCLDAVATVDGLRSTTVVLGPPHGACLAKAIEPRSSGLHMVHHSESGKGLGDSIALGVRSLGKLQPHEAILIVLPDQPELSPQVLATLVAGHDAMDGQGITAASYPQGHWGPPLLLGQRYQDALSSLSGSAGAKPLLRKSVQHLRKVTLPGFSGADLDTLDDLQQHGWKPQPASHLSLTAECEDAESASPPTAHRSG